MESLNFNAIALGVGGMGFPCVKVFKYNWLCVPTKTRDAPSKILNTLTTFNKVDHLPHVRGITFAFF